MEIRHQAESILQDAARTMACTIRDREAEIRETTPEEAEKLYTIAYGALLTINYVGRAQDAGSMIQGAMDCAEFTFDIMFPGCNGYDSLYCKLADYVRDNRTK